MSQVVELPIGSWSPELGGEESRRYAAELEAGKVLYLPRLGFALEPQEKRFLDPRWSNAKAKNISYDPVGAQIKGAIGNTSDLEDLRRLLERFHQDAVGLVQRLFPAYTARLCIARASLRPMPVEGRVSSWRKDDTRLHIDAFPSRPNRGERILRVFSNVNPGCEPRVWRVGEPFESLAQRMLPRLRRPFPGSAFVMEQLRITKSRRSTYDHYMLQLHDSMKADLGYQKTVPQEGIAFPPGSSWICFSDQTSHAAMSGQHLLEQTLHVPVEGLYDPLSSPLKVLERLTGRALL